VFFHVWVFDPGAAQLWSATNALRAVAQGP
jgi:hypothetical protein